MTKEYMSRHDKPIVNPGFTLEEYETSRESDLKIDWNTYVEHGILVFETKD